MKTEVLIIGAGLTGLLLGYRLKKERISFRIIESRNRIGGRIHTVNSANETPIEMGATWLSTQHQELLLLLKELKTPVFEQFMDGIALFESLSTAPPQPIQLPKNQQPSYRIKGGTHTVINVLGKHLDPEELILNEKIKTINYTSKDGFTLHSENQKYLSKKVISTLPPMLLVNAIQFSPALPEEIVTIANKTHTWMGDSIKFGLSYSTPFWKEKNYSGTVFSNVGPITELYDHSNYENDRYALKGFLQSNIYTDTKENRTSKVVNQLQKLFGAEASTYLKYEESVWRNESETFVPAAHFVLPHQNNGHSLYQTPIYNKNLYIGGAETALQFGGYMEGAIRSAQSIYQKLKKQ